MINSQQIIKDLSKLYTKRGELRKKYFKEDEEIRIEIESILECFETSS